MAFIRWAILGGFFLVSVGALFMTYFDSERLGFNVALLGFIVILVGIVIGNWKASALEEISAYKTAHRICIAGFCISMAGIFVGEYSANIGAILMSSGIATIFLGVLMVMWKRRKED